MAKPEPDRVDTLPEGASAEMRYLVSHVRDRLVARLWLARLCNEPQFSL